MTHRWSGLWAISRTIGLALLILAALMPSVSLAEAGGREAESLATAVRLQSPMLQCGLAPTAAEATRVAESRLCCCEGFDGKQCCAQASDCSVSPPGCFCRPRK